MKAIRPAIKQLFNKKLSKKMLTLAVAGTVFTVAATVAPPHQTAEASGTAPVAPANSQQVFFVGNNWDGTVTVIRPNGDFGKIGTINMIPDRKERMWEIIWNPIKLIAFLYIRNSAGEGNDQLVDDMYSSPDGRAIIASRPSYADVVSIDVETGKVKWRFPVKGFRADHMAVSPDGMQVAVSASSGNVVHVLDINTGKELGNFKTGDKPHENIYFDGGKKILNSSIGNVETPYDAPWQDFTKGDRKLTIADATTYEVVKTIDLRPALDAFGRKDLSDSVRPVVFSPDENTLYGQVSFFNGLFEYDMVSDKITRIVQLPGSSTIPKDRTKWVNDSRHHGLSISPDGAKLCAAGTMDDYVTIVDTQTLTHSKLVYANKPYWATVTPDGQNCLISESEGDSVTVVSFDTGEKVTTVPVGNHPQRVRIGYLPSGWKGVNAG